MSFSVGARVPNQKDIQFIIMYHIKKALNPHIWEAETSKCLGFLLKKKIK